MFSRRQFLGAAAAAAATLPVVNCASGAPPAPTDGFIDAHVHIWTPDTDTYPLASGYSKQDMVPASFTPEELFAHSKPSGVARIVLIQMSFYGFDNRYMLAAIERYPGVFSGVAIVDENAADTPDKMKTLRQQGVRGFRLYTDKAKAEAWKNSPGMKAMWSTAADLGQAMCLLANPDALPAVLEMCQQYPRTRVVIDHFARIGMSGTIDPRDLDNLCRLAKYGNVFVKTSAFYALGKKQPPYTDLLPMIQRLVQEFGAQRLMWASDCPYQVQGEHTYAASIGLIRDHLPTLSTAQRDSLLRSTAEQVFFS